MFDLPAIYYTQFSAWEKLKNNKKTQTRPVSLGIFIGFIEALLLLGLYSIEKTLSLVVGVGVLLD